jgi:hypothetical protein
MPRKKKVIFKPPKLVRILGVDHEVVLGDVAGESGRRAEILFWKNRIRLDQDNPSPCSLIHEMIHVLDERLKLGLGEDGVIRMDAALTVLVADNPAVFRHLANVLERKS